MHAMPLLLGILCLMAIAYRYYSAFLAAKVATLDDSRTTPAYRFDDGQNFHPTNKWVLFGHHFAAISGAGPLIGPVLAAQFGYMPGLLWIVIGVCLAGAVQDFLALAASIRRDGKSLAQIAVQDVGPVAGTAATIAILFIIVIALAGLGKVVVKALGGETVSYQNATIVFAQPDPPTMTAKGTYIVPAGSKLVYANTPGEGMRFNEQFELRAPAPLTGFKETTDGSAKVQSIVLPKDTVRLVPGSSWGTFTIACTIPIALFVGLYMYKLRPGKVVEASLIGGALTIGATVLGGFIHDTRVEHWFNLSANGVTWSMAVYGFVAAVLPVWVLLAPRDYLSSFLKIGTIALLVFGTILANPKFEAPALNMTFFKGGPVLGATNGIFPFLFITVMCGAISGFHALVASGTTPKMIQKESHARTIGYGAMLIEGLVAVVAMIAASTLPVRDYYAMNTELGNMPQFHDRILEVAGPHGVEDIGMYEERTQESLRGRTGGAVTLAVGMAHIFDGAAKRISGGAEETLKSLWKYWYHFAIMFEALFILTTIDAGTRIGRFLLQEVAGKLSPSLGIRGGWPSAIVSTGLIVFAWAWFMNSDQFRTVWTMFGIANQMLAVIALAVISAFLANEGKGAYLWVTVIPMGLVLTTTSSAAIVLLQVQIDGFLTQIRNTPETRNGLLLFNSALQAGLIIAMLVCTLTVLAASAARIWRVYIAPRAGGFPVVAEPAN